MSFEEILGGRESLAISKKPLPYLTPIRKNNRGISGFEQLRTPVTGILTPIRINIRGIYGVDHDMTAVTDILIVGLQLH